MSREYLSSEPTRAELDAMSGVVVVEFGTAWCGYCQAAQPAIASALSAHPQIQHLKITDGPGQPLGRSFRVKLWPTLVALRDGIELGRVVRPQGPDEIAKLLASSTSSG